ncbi:MAG: hypothetical protein ACK5MH_04100 [Bacteroidales bacterium]|jgi:hypothetical protein
MSVLNWKKGKWIELGSGIAFGLVAGVLIYLYNPRFSDWKMIIEGFPSVAMCAFGFLLTLLGLTLQSNSSTVKYLKSRKILYNKFVSFNKRVVYLAFFISIFSYVIAYAKTPNCIYDIYCLKRVILSVWLFFVTWFLWDLYYFVYLFYDIIKERDT